MNSIKYLLVFFVMIQIIAKVNAAPLNLLDKEQLLITTPTISASGPLNICEGQSVVLTANADAGVSFQWYKDGVLLANEVNQQYTASQSGDYTVKVNNGIESSTSAATKVTVKSQGIVTVTSNTNSVCDGEEIVQWTDGVGVNTNGQSVTKTSAFVAGVWNAGAKSLQELRGNGYVEYVINSTTGLHTFFGLSKKSLVSGSTALDYSFRLDGAGWLDIIEKGVGKKRTDKFAWGDKLKIVIQGNKVIYMRNDKFYYESLIAPDFPLVANVCLYQHVTITNVKIHKTISSNTPISFSASANPDGGVTSFKWFLNGSQVGNNTNTYTYTNNLKNDFIECKATFDNTCNVEGTSNLIAISGYAPNVSEVTVPPVEATVCDGEELVQWQSVKGTNVNSNSTWKVLTTHGHDNLSTSMQVLRGPGYFEYVFGTELSSNVYFGFGKEDKVIGGAGLDFGIYVEGGRKPIVYESGRWQKMWKAYVPGDKVRIQIQESKVAYYFNDELFYTSNTTPVFPLILKATFHFENSTIKNAVIHKSVPTTNPIQFVAQTNPNLAGELINYKWFLNNFETGTNSSIYNYTNNSKGDKINCIALFNNSCQSIATSAASIVNTTSASTSQIEITSEDLKVCDGEELIKWENVVGNNVSDNATWKVNSSSAYDNLSKSIQQLNGPGYFECVFGSELSTNAIFGLSYNDDKQGAAGIDFGIFIEGGRKPMVYENGVGRKVWVAYKPTDKVRIQVQENKVLYFFNDELFYQSNGVVKFPLIAKAIFYFTGSTIRDAKIYKTISENKPIQFVATPAPKPEGAAINYKWFLNNAETGSNSNMYSYNNNIKGDKVRCIASYNNTCHSIASSTQAVVSSTPALTTQLDLTSEDLSVCDGEELVKWENVVGTKVNDNSTWKIANSSGLDNLSISTQVIDKQGYFEYTFGTELSTNVIFGLSKVDKLLGISAIDYGIYVEGNGIPIVYEKGQQRKPWARYKAGDKVRIQVQEGKVLYFFNDQLYYHSVLAPQYPLIAKVMFHFTGSTMKNAKIHKTIPSSNPIEFVAHPIPNSTVAKINYKWYLNNAETGSNSNIYSYSNNMKGDKIRCIASYNNTCHNIGVSTSLTTIGSAAVNGQVIIATNDPSVCDGEELVKWQTQVGTSIDESSTWKAVNSTGFDNLSTSKQQITGHGYFEYVFGSELSTNVIFGLAKNNFDIGGSGLDYGILVDANKIVKVYESGAEGKIWKEYVPGDKVRIQVQDNKINYFFNGEFFFQSEVAPSFPLIAKVSFYAQNSILKNAKIHKTLSNDWPIEFKAEVNPDPYGINKTYQWYLNEVPTGTNSYQYTYNNYLKNDKVRCEVSYNSMCYTKGTSPNTIIEVSPFCNPPDVYYFLNTSKSLTYATTTEDKKLKVFYKEEYKNGNLTYRVYDYKENHFEGTVPKSIGENLLSLDLNGKILSGGELLQEGKVYTLEVIGEKNDKYYLNFKY